MSIKNDCMTVSMVVGTWTGQRIDKATSAKVTTEAGAHSDAGRFNKHLMPKESLAAITTKVSALRTHLYANTLPWKDNGDRLLTRKSFQTFMFAHEKLRDEFSAEVDDFLHKKYLAARDQAEFRMGDLFDESDYPSPTLLRNKFYVALDIDGISDAYDFRLEADDSILQKRVTQAMGSLWDKLAKPLEHFRDKMMDPECVFRDTTVSNLRDILEVLPTLNFTGDKQLDELAERCAKHLAVYEAKDLRNNKVTRAAVASEADEILKSMSGFMRAMGATDV